MESNDSTRKNGRPGPQAAGQQAEDLAAAFLTQRGLRMLTRNYRCRGGEIDLIARDGKTLVFVEVRLRRNPAYGGAGESITKTKQRRVILAARHYLAAHAVGQSACRFDCVLLSGTGGQPDDIEWLRDAFAAD